MGRFGSRVCAGELVRRLRKHGLKEETGWLEKMKYTTPGDVV